MSPPTTNTDTESDETVTRALEHTGEGLRRAPSVRNEVLRRVTQASLKPAQNRSHLWRWQTVAGVLAACVLITIGLLQLLGGERASQAWAQAIDAVAKAHTFSCRQISHDVQEDGKVKIYEMAYMFKEPDRSRLETREGTGAGQIAISDYSRHRRLTLSADKVAGLEDITKTYEMDDKTGELLPASLNTDVRDQVMRLTAESVKRLADAELNGKSVRVYQSTGKKSGTVRTVYIDPSTNQPVQIVLTWPQSPKSSWTFADIQIDQPLDDSLFSLAIPAGYQPFRGGQAYVPAEEHFTKMMTKMRHLGMALIMYANDHNNQYPTDLKQLIGPDMSEKKLKTLLAADGQSDGPPVMQYRVPNANTQDNSSEIVLYELESSRQDKKVCAAFLDGHAQVMSEEEFNDAMKKLTSK